VSRLTAFSASNERQSILFFFFSLFSATSTDISELPIVLCVMWLMPWLYSGGNNTAVEAVGRSPFFLRILPTFAYSLQPNGNNSETSRKKDKRKMSRRD
jgi:hypothetical protein